MAWFYLILAILFEVSGTICMKFSEGFTKIGPSLLIFFFYGLGFIFSTISLKSIEVSVAYSVWSGLGTALIASIGIGLFNESATPAKIISITLIVIGVIGLNSGK